MSPICLKYLNILCGNSVKVENCYTFFIYIKNVTILSIYPKKRLG